MKEFFLKTNVLYFVAKIIIVGVFLYFGIESIFNPSTYSGLVPEFLTKIFSADFLVMIHCGVEVIFSLMILFGLGGFWSYIVLVASFIGVLISVSGTTFVRDIGILGSLLLLAHVYLKRENTPTDK